MDFTFAAIDIGISENDKIGMVQEIWSLDKKYEHFNKFRNCKMIPIYNGGGKLGVNNEGSNTKKGMFQYTSAGEECPTIKNICENKIFPFMNIPGRVTILKTTPETSLNIHLDSKKEEIGTLQHKFRIVLNGNIEKLYFLDNNCNKIYVPPYYDTYVMDGSHPHSLDCDPVEKITLCVGAPWQGESTKMYEKILSKSAYKLFISRPKTQDIWLDKK